VTLLLPPLPLGYSRAVTKSRRPPRASKAPKRGDALLPAGPNTIPVQAEWLEGDDPPRPSSRPRLRQKPPPLPSLVTDYFDDAQRALQRLQALHPARDNERLRDELEKKLKKAMDAGQATVTTRHGHVVLKIAIEALFASGEANVKPAGAKALTEIAGVLSATAGERFQVEGHSPGASSAEWTLCASRAMSVARRLAASGIAARTISVAAFAALEVEPQAKSHGIAIAVLRGEAPPVLVDNR
jgi:flagellar motor protein MotB